MLLSFHLCRLCIRFTTSVPEVGNFDVVILDEINNFVQPIRHDTTIHHSAVGKERLNGTQIGILGKKRIDVVDVL